MTADGVDGAVAQDEVVAHALTAQVERPVAQAQQRVDLDVLVEREGRGVGLGEDLDLGDLDLDRPGGEVRVDVLGVAEHDRPGGAEHVLGAQAMGGGVRSGVVGVERRAARSPSGRAGR